ncbi:MAG TPA: tryptophanase [bacterium]
MKKVSVPSKNPASRHNDQQPFVMEPYRVKVIEPLSFLTRAQRVKIIKKAGFNTFLVPAQSVLIDLISDSGTGAMSSAQWARMFEAREDFSGQTSSADFIKTAREITRLPNIQIVHQGRVAENILFRALLKSGEMVLSNTHFETTRGNIETMGCSACDLLKPEPPFYGNFDIERARRMIKKTQKVRAVIMTITNNINGGQAVAYDNIKDTAALARKHGLYLILDACRFADNAFLNKEYERRPESILRLCQQTFGLCDIAYMSNKKDALTNIGGFIGTRDHRLFSRIQHEIIKQESYPSSGGMAARDIAAMRNGLLEAVNEDFIRSHIASLRYFADRLRNHRVRIFEPVGGHGIVVRPKGAAKYAAFALAAKVFTETGIRGGVFNCEFRLALPRRVYTTRHLEYAANAIAGVYHKDLPVLKCTCEPPHFFNFFARFTLS